MRVRRFGVRRLRGGDLRLQVLDLGVELPAFSLRCQPLFFRIVACFDSVRKSARDLLQLGELGDRDRRCARQSVGREGERCVGVGAPAIGPREPVGQVKQFADSGDSLCRRHGLRLMDGRIAEVLNDPRLGDERRTDERLKRRFVDTSGEGRAVGVSEAPIVAIEPLDHHFQREASVETSRSGVAMGEVFRPRRVFMHGGEFGGEECELRHGPAVWRYSTAPIRAMSFFRRPLTRPLSETPRALAQSAR